DVAVTSVLGGETDTGEGAPASRFERGAERRVVLPLRHHDPRAGHEDEAPLPRRREVEAGVPQRMRNESEPSLRAQRRRRDGDIEGVRVATQGVAAVGERTREA